MANISGALIKWLTEQEADVRKVRFSSSSAFSEEQWIRLSDFAMKNASLLRETFRSTDDELLAIERVAAVISLHGVRPVSPSMVRNSSSVMSVLKA